MMTADDFRLWIETLGISNAEASRRLGLAPNTITAYTKGRWPVPRHVALACAAVSAGLEPWQA